MTAARDCAEIQNRIELELVCLCKGNELIKRELRLISFRVARLLATSREQNRSSKHFRTPAFYANHAISALKEMGVILLIFIRLASIKSGGHLLPTLLDCCSFIEVKNNTLPRRVLSSGFSAYLSIMESVRSFDHNVIDMDTHKQVLVKVSTESKHEAIREYFHRYASALDNEDSALPGPMSNSGSSKSLDRTVLYSCSPYKTVVLAQFLDALATNPSYGSKKPLVLYLLALRDVLCEKHLQPNQMQLRAVIGLNRTFIMVHQEQFNADYVAISRVFENVVSAVAFTSGSFNMPDSVSTRWDKHRGVEKEKKVRNVLNTVQSFVDINGTLRGFCDPPRPDNLHGVNKK